MLKTLDTVEEQREKAQLRVTAYQQKIAKYFKSQVRERKFMIEDLVIRCVFLNTRDLTAGVLRHNRKGPYQIEEVLDPGTYKLARLNGELVPQGVACI